MKYKWKKISQKNTVILCETKEQALELYEKACRRTRHRYLTSKEKNLLEVTINDGMYIQPITGDYYSSKDLTLYTKILEFKDIVKNKKQCKWKYNKKHDIYESACGENSWVDNDQVTCLIYCAYCGKKIKLKENK